MSSPRPKKTPTLFLKLRRLMLVQTIIVSEPSNNLYDPDQSPIVDDVHGCVDSECWRHEARRLQSDDTFLAPSKSIAGMWELRQHRDGVGYPSGAPAVPETSEPSSTTDDAFSFLPSTGPTFFEASHLSPAPTQFETSQGLVAPIKEQQPSLFPSSSLRPSTTAASPTSSRIPSPAAQDEPTSQPIQGTETFLRSEPTAAPSGSSDTPGSNSLITALFGTILLVGIMALMAVADLLFCTRSVDNADDRGVVQEIEVREGQEDFNESISQDATASGQRPFGRGRFSNSVARNTRQQQLDSLESETHLPYDVPTIWFDY